MADPLPRKIVSGAALLFDERGRLLVVNPTYKPEWEIPGGIAEQGEPPSVACHREVLEELGLELSVGPLLCVEWRPPRAPNVDGIHFIFEGGVLGAGDIAAIRLPADELSEFAFLAPEEALSRLPLRLANRVAAALSVRPAGPAVYLEAGARVGGGW